MLQSFCITFILRASLWETAILTYTDRREAVWNSCQDLNQKSNSSNITLSPFSLTIPRHGPMYEPVARTIMSPTTPTAFLSYQWSFVCGWGHVSLLFHIGLSIEVLFRQPCWWDFPGATSLTLVGNTTSQQTSYSSGFYNLSSPPHNDPWALGIVVQELCCRCVYQLGLCTTGSLVFCILIGSSFLERSYLVQREVSLMNTENCSYL